MNRRCAPLDFGNRIILAPCFWERVYLAHVKKFTKMFAKSPMKNGKMFFWVGCYIVLCLSGWHLACNRILFVYETGKKEAQRKMKDTNPSVLLDACREMITNYTRWNSTDSATCAANRIAYFEALKTNLPPIIRQLHRPNHVCVDQNEVYIMVHDQPRMGFIACREGYKTEMWDERTRTEVTNGLWIFRE